MINRRDFFGNLGTAALALMINPLKKLNQTLLNSNSMTPAILKTEPLGFQWPTLDPFLFCVHHEDYFPAGNENMGPNENYLKGRHIGDDFIIKDGFRMYHGKTVPGFPGHPHRGFETITIVRKGVVDHADSLGASGRYGNGDVQWMTAGKGVQHSELFQIWLNLPKKNKMVEPHFKMLWREKIPQLKFKDAANNETLVELIFGKLNSNTFYEAPPDSWASDPANELMILNIKMNEGAEWQLEGASKDVNRMLYFYEGESLTILEDKINSYCSIQLNPTQKVNLKAGKGGASILVLQGKPINEQVMQYGPFVMNTKEEINQAFEDYHKTQFGGWPWSRYDQVHDRTKNRFAKHADGTIEEKQS
jgi:redox-sensitive bicupin YhaK (pirin superfamily)